MNVGDDLETRIESGSAFVSLKNIDHGVQNSVNLTFFYVCFSPYLSGLNFELSGPFILISTSKVGSLK